MFIGEFPSRKISELIAEQIEQWIANGLIQQGEKLPSVRELCDRFHVGRSAVRDAINTLKGKGIVEVKQGEGAYVCKRDLTPLFGGTFHAEKQRDPDNIQKLFSVRKILESAIAEQAAIYRQEHNLAKMEQAVQELANPDAVDGWKADYQFHLAVAEATQNEHLVELIHTLSTVLQEAIIQCHRMISADAELHRHIQEQHLAVYRAIDRQQSVEAKERMLEHLVFVEKLLGGRM